MTILLARADARALPLRDGSVQCCVTSPPYWGLRDYGTPGQLGLESTHTEYVAHMVEVFREVRRVLRDDGVLWLNLGDCWHSGDRGGWRGDHHRWEKSELQRGNRGNADGVRPNRLQQEGLKDKDLCGMPWRVALALQSDGWWLRSDIIWHKPNPMPSSVTDRPTCAHEYLFLLSKSATYFYDSVAVKEPSKYAGKIVTLGEKSLSRGQANGMGVKASGNGEADSVIVSENRNLRSVWTITTKPYKGSHYAVMPEKLVEPCIKAGSRVGDVVLDPFCGTATVARVAIAHGRRAVCFDLSGEYLSKLATKRTHNVQIEMIG
jgi:DNA modification methylase